MNTDQPPPRAARRRPTIRVLVLVRVRGARTRNGAFEHVYAYAYEYASVYGKRIGGPRVHARTLGPSAPSGLHRAADQGGVNGANDLADYQLAVAVEIGDGALLEQLQAEGDVHGAQQLVDGDVEVAIAVAAAFRVAQAG